MRNSVLDTVMCKEKLISSEELNIIFNKVIYLYSYTK